MRPLIPRRAYYDDDVYAREQRTLFAREWQLAGFAGDLTAPNDYITAEVGGKSVVVQNFDGQLRALGNVCSHRFARIRCDAKGNGKLRCPYHGWIYDAEGIPYSIPSRPRFDDLQDRSEVAKLALRAYDVDRCGGLIFVREVQHRAGHGNDVSTPPTLREFLADAFPVVEQMSNALGSRVYDNVIDFKSNWKVAVENGLEAYHVGFVHENTFKTLGTSGMDFRFSGAHSAWLTGVEAQTAARMAKLAKLSRMPAAMDGYIHQFIFPNLTISSVCGTAFGFQLLTPLSPGTTRLTGAVFLSVMEADANVTTMVSDMLGSASARFTLDVAHEDRAVCEAVQLGLPESTQPGILSDEEERVYRFQEAYQRCLGDI